MKQKEDQMVYNSVKIDRENKQIVCYLPVRGEEKEFLSDNREITAKILRQQCKKYYNDEETKSIIQKSFQKLKDNGHMILWDELSTEERNMIVRKEVQHYIVCRVVFEHSLSSPARPVFDGSSRTKPWPDGSRGRCLNELVMKGKVSLLNLLKMVLQFLVGSEAVQGDLK